MEDLRTLEHYHEAKARYYKLFRGCVWRRCFWCGEFFKLPRTRLNSLNALSMYCSKECRRATTNLRTKMWHRKRKEAKPQTQYDMVLDMSKPMDEWEWTPKNA